MINRCESSKYKVSVVVTVFNKGEFFESAIEALINQTLDSYEIICVDDHSTDERTKKALIELVKYPNVTVITNLQNMGAGLSRNIGFEYACGEYVIFLDGDDLFDADMLEQMYKKAKETGADICLCSTEWFYPDGSKKVCEVPVVDKNTEDWLINISHNPIDKLVKRDLLTNERVYFQNLTSSNDVYYSISLYILSDKISYCKNHSYVHYRAGIKNQISYNRNPENIIAVASELYENFQTDESVSISGIALFLIVNLIREYERNGYREADSGSYEKAKAFLASYKDEISYFKDWYTYIYSEFWNNDYDSCWYKDVFQSDKKVDLGFNNISRLIAGYQRPLLWGCGKRGQEFLNLCRKRQIQIWGVADLNLFNNRNNSMYEGIPVKSIEEAVIGADIIIVSNHEIRGYVSQLTQNPIVDIEDYW